MDGPYRRLIEAVVGAGGLCLTSTHGYHANNRLEEQGEILALPSGIPLSLQDPEKIWIVLEGKLDLYLVEMRDGEPAGARHHFMRVEAGNPVMGFDKLPDAAFGVIANPAVGSKVLLSANSNNSGRPQPVRRNRSCPSSTNGWKLLARPWQTSLPPRNSNILAPGAEILVEGKPTALLPLTGVVWVRHQEGNSRLLGDDQMPPIEPGRFFPVSRVAWLRVRPARTIWDASAPATGWRRTRSGRACGIFRNRRLPIWWSNWRRNEQKEKARLRVVAEADANVFEAALYKLAEPLRGGEETPLEAETGAVDPLLQVCRLVGSASGIQIPFVPRALEFIRQRDPVSAIAQAARVRTRQVMLKGQWWKQESGPMVAFLEQDKRPVALLPGRRGYQLYDPAHAREDASSMKNSPPSSMVSPTSSTGPSLPRR